MQRYTSMTADKRGEKDRPANVILDVRDLCVSYKTGSGLVRAVEHMNLSIYEGESVGLVGESGSGKSTLAMAILRLLPSKITQVEGSVFFKGRDLLTMSSEEMTKLRWVEISVVFQKSMNALSPVHKIGEQMIDVYRVHRPDATLEEFHEKVDGLLNVVNLAPRVLDLYPHELSGGMMQRASIAMSLIHRPSFVVFDEATTALDVITQGQILKEITRLETELNLTSVIITHDISVVAETCKRVAVMYAGRLMEMGKVVTVLQKPSHPYTMGLIESFPSLKGCRKTITGIPGSLPDLTVTPKGCIFAPRCKKAMDRCFLETPPLRDLGDGHLAACHQLGGEVS